EEHPDACRRTLADDLSHGCRAERVKSRERFVEHEQLRVVDEGRGELDSLLVPVRQLLELRLLAIVEAEPFEPAPGRRIGRLARQAVLLAEVAQLLADTHPRIQATLLGHVPEAQPGDAVDRTAGPAHLTAIGPGQPEDAAHRRGLAG